MFSFDASPSLLAIDYIRRKAAVKSDVWARLLPELRAHAFTVSGVESADVLQAMRDAIAEIPRGADYKQVRSEIERLLNEELPLDAELFDDPERRAAHAAGLRRRAEFIVRNQVNAGYAAVAWADLMASRAVLPFWKYIDMDDARVRASHAALNNLILPAGHEFWRTHFPPWEFGCRCQIVGVTRAEADEIREREKDRPAHKRTLLEGEALALLENERAIWRDIGGRPEKISVAAPVERGDSAWIFDPRDLSASFSGVRQRYEAGVWAAFEKWARATDYTPGRTVWSWLSPAVERGAAQAAKDGATKALASARDFERAAQALMSAATKGKGKVSLKGAHVKTARAMHDSLAEHLRDFPALADHLQYYGTSTGQGEWVKEAFEAEVRASVEAWNASRVFGSEEERARVIESQIKRALSQKVLRSPKTLAFYWQKRIVTNPDYTKDGPERDERSAKAHAMGWWPKTIPEDKQAKATMDHEIAHALDAITSARDNLEMRELWMQEVRHLTREQAAEALSIYGASRIAEMIAEGWSEFRNAPAPRPIARRVGAILQKLLRRLTP